MVLLKSGKNVALGNSGFETKREAYRQSAYIVTSEVADYVNWTVDDIRDRQTKMAEIALKTWSMDLT